MSDNSDSSPSSSTSPTIADSSVLQTPGSESADGSARVRGEGRGRNGPRSRNGCWTCRTKKVKCDEKRPKCLRCVRLRLLCDYEPRTKRQSVNPAVKPDITSPISSNTLSPSDPTLNNAVTRTHPWLMCLPAWAGDISIPRRISDVGTSASSLELTSADHESIRYYRTTFAKHQHTKSTDYSMYSLMFNLAERDPMVMRSLLALGSREIQYRKTGPITDDNSPGCFAAVRHYSEALRHMAETVGAENDTEVDIDSLCAGIFLLMLYEQKFGDSDGIGWTNHLKGAALVIQHRFNDWPERTSVTGNESPPHDSNALVKGTSGNPKPRLSLFAARALVYITVHDAAASTFGLGGQVNTVMYQIVHNYNSKATPLDSYHLLHRYSHALYRTAWAENYPQKELLDDIENRTVFGLIGSCFMLRWMVADASMSDIETARLRVPEIQAAIDKTTEQYGELLAVASELSAKTDGSQRIAVNIRAFVPYYYAILLEFRRLCNDVGLLDKSEGTGSTDADALMHVRTIMTLATQTYKHMGTGTMQMIAWPLLIAGLETDSQSHRDWLLARFQGMGGYSKNYERAHQFLAKALDIQATTGQRVNILQLLGSGQVEKFVM